MVLLSACVVAICVSIRSPYWLSNIIDQRAIRIRDRKAIRVGDAAFPPANRR